MILLNIFIGTGNYKISKEQIGAVCSLKCSQQNDYPNTLGKTLRKLMRSIADGDDYQTIND
jgi:hypothetical protein